MKRLPLPDLLKGFAVFMIVPVHILEFFINAPGRESLFGKILLFMGGPVCVPVFMITMGYFVARNRKTPGQNFLRGIKIFTLGFHLNIGLNFHLLWKIVFSGWAYNPWEYILGVDIFYLAGLSLMFLSWLKSLKKGREWVALILFFGIAGLTGGMNSLVMPAGENYVIPFIAGAYSWSYFPLFPWLAYPLAGFAFFHFEAPVLLWVGRHKAATRLLLLIIAALVVAFGKSGVFTTIDLPAYYHHTFLFSLWATGIVILWAAFLRYLLPKWQDVSLIRFLRWLGKNITVFYIVQWLIIGNIATAIYQTQRLSMYPFWLAGIFAATVLITWIIEKKSIRLT